MSVSEKKIADAFAKGNFKRKANPKSLKKIVEKPKEARINLRLHEDVLKYFQEMSIKEGIPYQTLINSALFKVATGQFVESQDLELKKMLKEINQKINKLKKNA